MKINNINRKGIIKNKLIIGTLLAGILTTTGCTTKTPTKQETANTKGISYTNMNYGSLNEESNEYSFSLADCGNYRIGLSINASTLLNDKTLPTGIIIRSTSTKESEMYKEVDYVKSLVSQYDIDYPVFLDIDKLCEINDMSNVNKLVRTFYNKLQNNGLYVYIMGNKDNLSKISVFDSNKMVVLNDDVLTEDDEYNMAFINNDLIVSGIKHDYIINKYNFNQEDRFVDDFTYNMNEGETIWDLSEVLDVNEKLIMEYNNIEDETNIHVGTEIIVPSIYGGYLEEAKEKVKTIS